MIFFMNKSTQKSTHKSRTLCVYSTSQYSKSKGISLALVIALIAVISAIVLPMARTTIIEEKITRNQDWLNLIYNETRGEVYRQSSKDLTDIDDLIEAMDKEKSVRTKNLEDHTTEITYRNQHGIPYGYSIDRFKGFQFNVATEGDIKAIGGYNQQYMGITYIARGE